MRLVSLEVSGFRGFATKQVFDLDADAIIVVAANGHGKTSIFDGILWALAGYVPRLGEDASVILSKFSQTGEAKASVLLRRRNGSPCRITRTFDGTATRVAVEIDGHILRGPSAEGKVIELVWPDAAAAPEPGKALAAVLTRGVYLQQDLIREFIDAASEQQRFAAVSELVGAGRVADLQVRLERTKAAWTKATNATNTDAQTLRSQRALLETRIGEIQNRKPQSERPQLESGWNEWWRWFESHGGGPTSGSMGSGSAAASLDVALKQLVARRRAVERQSEILSVLEDDLASLTARPIIDVAQLRERLGNLKREAQDINQRVTHERERAAEVRQLQVALEEKTAQLRALAALALQQLGDRCPVCDQEYDHETTRHRLEALAANGSSTITKAEQEDGVGTLLAGLALKEKAVAEAETAMRTAERRNAERRQHEQLLGQRLKELSIDFATVTESRESVQRESDAIKQRLAALATLQSSGETLALGLVHAAEETRLEELRRELASIQLKVTEIDRLVADREATGDLAQRIIEALREATSSVVTTRLEEIGTLLQGVYSRIDPHPAFRVVSLMSEIVRGRGHLHTVIADPLRAVDSNAPNAILSSSQMNALAVAVFLSLNLGVAQPPLSAAILDDPLQSLDDINLLGLVDLLRRTKDSRQLCVSTHDKRFSQLLARKLRPRDSERRTIVIQLDAWTREGPVVETRDVSCDPAPLRLVAASADTEKFAS